MFKWLKNFFRKIDEKYTETFHITDKAMSEIFGFLTENYDLNFRQQIFKNCYGGNWCVSTYSFYNENGCLTFNYLLQRAELDLYYSKRYSEIHEDLRERRINEFEEIDENLWKNTQEKYKGAKGYALYLKTLADVIKQKIEEDGEIFGIIVNKK